MYKIHAKYIIDGKYWNCSKTEAIDIAKACGVDSIFIVGKQNHWHLNPASGNWFLLCGTCK